MLKELFEQLSVSLEAAKVEVESFAKGRKNAAGKLRKEAQTSRKLWQEVRKEVLAQLKAMPVKPKKEK
jgi:hypothetical protein